MFRADGTFNEKMTKRMSQRHRLDKYCNNGFQSVEKDVGNINKNRRFGL
jgi:hypothetical protein